MATRPIQRVLLVVAIDSEAAPIVQRLKLTKNEPTLCVSSARYKTPTSAVSYSGKVGGLDVHLAQNGPSTEYGICKVGTTAAFLTTYLSLDVFKPDLVISAGTAGGFKSNGADIASIFVSTTTVNHDRRIPLPGFKEFGLDKKATHPMSKIAASLGFQEGVVSTGNSLDYTKECMEHMKEHDAAVKEMEAAAVAEACRIYEVPFAAVKSVTDIVDGEHATEVEFIQNLGKSVERLKDAVFELLTAIDGKTLDEL